MDLRCKYCGMETTYGDASLTDKQTSCERDYQHSWEKVNKFDQIPGDAWRNTKDADLWATDELRCTECGFLFLVAFGGKATALRKFGGVTEMCPECDEFTPCVDSKHYSIKEANKSVVDDE